LTPILLPPQRSFAAAPAEFKALIASEVAKWRKLIQDAGVPTVN